MFANGDPSWLAQGRHGCPFVAYWNVRAALGKGIRAIAELADDNVDDQLGVAGLYFCALRNMETPPNSNSKLTYGY
jgi:hypothetical protein